MERVSVEERIRRAEERYYKTKENINRAENSKYCTKRRNTGII